MVNSSAQVKTGAWDPEEDDLLYYWQSKVGNKWSEVAKHIPGRTGQQCAQRWRHKVNPNIRRDKWTPEEDAKLIELVKTFGVGRWAEIARNCDGRTDQQCMGRWRRHLDPNIKRDSWSPEEDAKLRQLHAQYGTSWSRISKCLKGRTSQQCRARWHQINNGRGSSKAAVASAADSGSTAAEAGGRRGGTTGKRKPARRRRDYSDSEDDEPEDDEDDFEDDYEQEQHTEEAEQQQHQAYRVEDYKAHHAITSMACEVPYTLEMPIHPAAGMQMQQQYWNTAWETAAAASDDPASHGDVAYDADQHTAGSAEEEVSDDDYPASSMDRYSSRHEWSAVGKHNKARSRHRLVHSSHGAFTPQKESAWLPSSSQLLPSPSLAKRLHSSKEDQDTLVDRGDLDEEETAGAETLLQMAHLLRRESCEFEPPSLRRSDFITASTPPKRAVGDRPEVRNSDELSPSPFKRARSSRGAPAVSGGEPHSSRAPFCAARRPAASGGRKHMTCDDELEPSGAGQLQGAEGCHQDEDKTYMVSEIHDQTTDEADDDIDALGSGMGSVEYNNPLPDPARPSNASSLTVVGNAAATFLSPPPVARAQAKSNRWTGGMVTPRQPTAYQNLMSLLGSPSFDRMPGYASPPSAGKTQPSAATLAALQSPQPSCVHEPFWTPFTGLVKDGVLTRGTSDTPDLASGGKGRSGTDLFSPVRRSGSTGNKTLARRSLLASPAAAETRESDGARSTRSQSMSSGAEEAAANHVDGAGDTEAGPSPACRLQQPVHQLHHRVVRRLDQHEAWGTSTRPSPSKMRSPRKARQTPVGIGFSLFSPVKKQPVPLFDDSTSNLNVGYTPRKPTGSDVNLTIAPLSSTLPRSLEADLSPCAPVRNSSPATGEAAAAIHEPGTSPTGLTDRPLFRKPAAARSILSPVRSHLLQKQLKQQQQQIKQGDVAEQATPVSAKVQQTVSAAQPARIQMASGAQNSTQDDAAASRRQRSDSLGRDESDADTPVQARQPCSITSCSATPSTPAGQLPFNSEGDPRSDFVTPQQGMRPSRPLAPLHKDCLLAAAARSLAEADAATAKAVESNTAEASKQVVSLPSDTDEANGCGTAPGSADSNKLLSPEELMDSPLQIAQQQLQSPSQWHQGMVMLMQNLQQTPLQARSQAGDSAVGCNGIVRKEGVVVRAGSRALRRLQAELERGSSAAATHMATASSGQHDLLCSKSAGEVPAGHLPQADCIIDAASTPATTTTLASGQGHVSPSVSLTPAVISCSKADVLLMQGASSAAVAWPVQQRPDGGLVVSTAASCGDVAAVLQLTPPAAVGASKSVYEQKLTASVQDCAVPNIPQPSGVATTATKAVASALPTGTTMTGGRVSVVSIQPVTMLMNRSQPGTMPAVQPMLQALQQPSKSPTPFAGAISIPERFVNSHAVRSRLHALIDGV